MFLLLVLLLVAAGRFLVLDAHENAHVQNCVYLGGEPIKFMDVLAPTNSWVACVLPDELQETRALLDANTEAVGYQFIAFYDVFTALFFAVLAYFVGRRD